MFMMKSIKVLALCFTMLVAGACGQKTNGLPEIGGVKGPIFNIVNGQILLTLKLLNVTFDAGLKAPIPKTKNSFMEFAPNVEDGGMLVALYLDTADLQNVDIGLGDGNYLPDGRPVPGVAGGRLEDSLRVDTKWKDVSFFFHKTLFGVWLPFGFETAGISGYWNMYFNQKNVGYLGIVGSDEAHGYKSGGILFLKLNNLNNKSLKRLLKISKQNPHFVY